MLRSSVSIFSIICIFGLAACAPEIAGDPEGKKTTLKLQRLDNGNLEYCDENGECTELPYDGDCATVEIDVDLNTGATCERCVLDDGSVIDNGCGNVSVGCVVVTLPDPDCVVCAYVEGDVIYSSCVTEEPECSSDMDCTGPDGRYGRCINGQCINEPYCLNDAECPVGFFCQHDSAGDFGVCTPRQDECRANADCAAGMLCEFICASDCQGEDCTLTNGCAEGDENCIAPEQCHGVCVPGHQPPECYGDEECPAGMFCELNCWCDGGSPDDPATDAPEACECFGACMPETFDPCAALDEWSCIERPECEPEYMGWTCACPPCEAGDASCTCDCPDETNEEFVGCHLRQPQGPCEDLDEQVCIATPGCEPQYVSVGCACPACEPGSSDCPPCDCADPYTEFVGCIEAYRHFCEQLPIDECEMHPDCQLIEVGYGAPCYCEDCDPSGANCYCECPPPMLMCVPREDPRGECYSDADCPEGFICDLSIYDPQTGTCPEGADDCADRVAMAGVCMPDQPWTGECGPDRPCPAGMACEELCQCGAIDRDGDGVIDEEICDCFGVCVGEPRPECYSDLDCADGERCELYDYADPCPQGDPDCTGGGLVAAAGVCVPVEEPLVCWGDEECPSDMVCDMQNYCELPPGCGDDPNTACPAVCYGRCVYPTTLTCANVRCEQGTHCEMVMPPCLPDQWCEEQPVCLPDTEGCRSDDECAAGQVCYPVDCADPGVDCGMGGICGPA